MLVIVSEFSSNKAVDEIAKINIFTACVKFTKLARDMSLNPEIRTYKSKIPPTQENIQQEIEDAAEQHQERTQFVNTVTVQEVNSNDGPNVQVNFIQTVQITFLLQGHKNCTGTVQTCLRINYRD
jgi:hypothetical protein